MQGEANALEEKHPVFSWDILHPFIIIIVKKHPVEHIEKIIFIPQRWQQLMSQSAKKFLPETSCQRNTAFRQGGGKIGAYQLGKNGVLQIAQQHRALMQSGGDAMDILFPRQSVR